MKPYKTIVLSILLGVLTATASYVYIIESQKRTLQEELIELSMVKYGLFNVDVWKAELTEIISRRINEFELEQDREEELRERISSFLDSAVDELEESFNEHNSGSVKGFIKKNVASLTDVFGVMKEDIPVITESIIRFIRDPENRALAQEFLIKKMEEYSDNTFSEVDYSSYNLILQKYGYDTKEEAIQGIKSRIDKKRAQRLPFSIFIFSSVIILFVYLLFTSSHKPIHYLLLTIICAVLLGVGLLLPMINIDARVSEMNFQLLGETISFTDQVLYFKSKSILEVVSLMVLNAKIDVVLVGILVFSFSVLFPVSKLIASTIYLYKPAYREQKWIKFLVFKTAKWSMADVMVVAIFMAYIGFSGIISEQLKDLETIVTHVDMMTTNASSLEVGFYFFTSFAVLSNLVSHKIMYGKEF